ncbi:hypothetical protein CCR75_001188 [Bremia lactucae]|uniref:Vacuolar ATPase assembly integral membrane protein VMA21 homolog n=1 Tax=Bremia lactucae TaxID=4779 RepID=A0A976IGD9_BRELC|nr:hypothetical protein CCR75_001188 [Bremia lactucae]
MSAENTSLSSMQRRAAGNRAHNRMVLQKLAMFSILMVLVPLSTFFGYSTPFGSGFSAVLSVNIVIGLYVLSAWTEDDKKEIALPVGRFAKPKEI